jgi:hypothetical protein
MRKPPAEREPDRRQMEGVVLSPDLDSIPELRSLEDDTVKLADVLVSRTQFDVEVVRIVAVELAGRSPEPSSLVGEDPV